MTLACCRAIVHVRFILWLWQRVHEYNEYCTQVVDLSYLDAQTKISWSCSGNIAGGVVKKRDFVTRSHYCAMEVHAQIRARACTDRGCNPPIPPPAP